MEINKIICHTDKVLFQTDFANYRRTMRKLFYSKIKEAFISVLPVTLIVIVLNLTPLVHFTFNEILIFCLSALFLILGIGFFTLGADVAMTPMVEHVESGLTQSKNLKLLLIVCFALGVGLFLILSVLKIVLKIDLGSVLVYFYMVMFAIPVDEAIGLGNANQMN